MDEESLRQRIGGAILRGRHALGWSQRRLAAEAGVSQHAVARADGGGDGDIKVLERLLKAVGARVTVKDAIAAEPPQSDVLHRTGIATMRRLYVRAAMPVATEQSIVDGLHRGSIDALSFREANARLVVTEVKSDLRDLGDTLRQVERYARSAMQPARLLGWHPKEIIVVLVVLATEDADAFVATNRAELAAAFPMRGRAAVHAILDGGPVTGRALLALDPFRVGRHALTSFRVDGRRQPFQFIHPADMRRAIEERDRRRAAPRP